MKNEKLLDLIGKLDDELIYNAVYTKPKRAKKWLIPLVATFCCAAIALGAFAVSLFDDKKSVPQTDASSTESNGLDSLAGYFTAADMADMFDLNKESTEATRTYTKSYAPSELVAPPTDGYAKAYKFVFHPQDPNVEQLEALSDSVLTKLSAALGVDKTKFILENQDYDTDTNDICIGSFYKNDCSDVELNENGEPLDPESFLPVNVLFTQYLGNVDTVTRFNTNNVCIYNDWVYSMKLYGKSLQIDQRQTEEEMAESLVWARDILFDIFGRTFDSVRVEMSQPEGYKYGAERICVYYYNESDTTNNFVSMGDRIMLEFDNTAHGDYEKYASTDVINRCKIYYTDYLLPVEKYSKVEIKWPIISLEKAEEHLKKGYVFGGEGCPICMEHQEEISFENYDFVNFEYVTKHNSKPLRSVPFYAFYKKTGTDKNGEAVYAKVYVCAFQVLGLEEYFQQ